MGGASVTIGSTEATERLTGVRLGGVVPLFGSGKARSGSGAGTWKDIVDSRLRRSIESILA
jgi:hypothetical protein